MKKLHLILGSCLLLAACGASEPSAQQVMLLGPKGQRITIIAEIADSPEERELGLMHRTDLPIQNGMLFVMPKEEVQAFWMKNTLIPLDIIYFSAAGRLVSTATMEPCETDPCPTYPSEAPALHALELNAGFVQEAGIGEGWRLVY